MSRAIFSSNRADNFLDGLLDVDGHHAASAGATPANLLPVDGEVYLFDAALAPTIADRAFADLMETIDWRQETATLFGRKIPLPRLTAWYGEHGYAYSGIRHEPVPMPPILTALKGEVERIASLAFNSVLINLYRGGRDSMGWHSDDEADLGRDPVITSLSLGATRRFQLKHRQSSELITLDLPHGSCLVMRGRCQACWRHQVPKTRKPVAPRINLTFRRLHA